MEVELSSLKPRSLSLSDCNSDPEEREVSDDDDRNHKHRRQGTRSQSPETDSIDPVLTRPYRKRHKPFLNGHSLRDSELLQTNVENFSKKIVRRCLGSASLPRASLDVNQRNRVNQSFLGNPGSGRERRSWNQWDSRFTDIASQILPQGSFSSSVIAGRGLPNVSNAQTASWNAFRLIPGMPNGGLDAFHSIGLHGTIRPPIHLLNMGITPLRCRDFEERGFCLRGDICPMEHGVNRIVIDDVQSLSQFNLPVSVPSVHLLGTSSGPGSIASVTASSTTDLNINGSHIKSSKHGTGDDRLGLNGACLDCAGGGDLYDPDQPLWNNTCPETSNALLSLDSPKIDETEVLLNGDPSGNEFSVRCTGNAVGSQSIWGRIGSLKRRSDVKDKVDYTVNNREYPENRTIKEKETLASTHASQQEKQILGEDTGSKPMDSSSRTQFDTMRNIRKPSQKATRTLFVNGIPQKRNRREALLTHFQKFGEVVNIYIPINSERAFIQFSKREDAETALKSPDAVMGNRFIKLWWANRDNIPDENTSNNSNLSVMPYGGTAVSVPLHSSVASSNKDNASLPVSDNAKHVISNGPKVLPVPKKLDSLEQLKEELRKKQELLEHKRNDLRRKLNKLQKHATGQKAESNTEQAAKRPKVGMGAAAEGSIQRSSDAVSGVEVPHAEMIDKSKAREGVISDSPKTKRTTTMQEAPLSKQQSFNPFSPVGAPFPMNRYKLDNRSTIFRVLPPLPAGLANVAVLKEHFLKYGDLSNVELDVEVHEDSIEAEPTKDCSACITFTTRRSAERAFVSGKCWQGHNLKFTWLTSSNSVNGHSGKQNSLSTSQGSLVTDVQAGEQPICDVCKEDASSGNKEHENEEVKKWH